MTASKPPPPTPTTPCKVHALQGFFMPAACQPTHPQSVHPYTEKKNRLAPLGSSQLLPAILLPYSACSTFRTVPYRTATRAKAQARSTFRDALLAETMRIASWEGCALGRAGHKPAAPQERKGCSFLALCILHTYAASCGYVSTGQCSTHRFARH